MAVITPPFVQQGGSHPAATFREMLMAVTGSPTGAFTNAVQPTTGGGGHGLAGPTDLAVTQNGTPNMSVNVAAGGCFVRGTEAAAQGVYAGFNDASVNLAVAASDPTNPRRDLVVMRVRDAFYSGASTDVSLFVVTGTAAAAPVDPTIPVNSLVIARIAVAAAVTTIVTANLTALAPRASSLGGLVSCTSTTRPTGSALFAGLRIFETDTFRELHYDGTGFVIMAEPPVTTFVPVVTSGTGAFTTVAATMAYSRLDGWLHFNATVTITTNGTAATSVLLTTPVAIDGSYPFLGAGRGNGVSTKLLQVVRSAGSIFITNFDNTYPGANGESLIIGGRARMTSRYS